MAASKHINTGNLHSHELTVGAGRGELLTVSASELSFIQTTADKPTFLVLTLIQQGSIDPVMLTTDAPEYFQFATDSRPIFLPNLTLTPDTISTGIYVHVRYFSAKAGVHTGQLIIQNGLETKYVALVGHHTRFLPAIQSPWPVIRKSAKTGWPLDFSLSRQVMVRVLALPVLLSIAYAAFTYRSQYMPIVHHSANKVSQTNGQNKRMDLALVHNNATVKTPKKDVPIARKSSENTVASSREKETRPIPPARLPSAKSSTSNDQADIPLQKADIPLQKKELVASVETLADQRKVDKQKPDAQLGKKQYRNNNTSSLSNDSATAVSELERLLNQP